MRVELVPLSSVAQGPNVRTAGDPSGDAGLTESIRALGVRQPIGVVAAGQGFRVVFGARRLRCAAAAGLASIPAVVLSDGETEEQALRLGLVENLQRAELNPLDAAAGAAALMRAAGCNAAGVAERLSVSPATVSRWLALLRLSEADQSRVRSGEIGLAAGYALAKKAARRNAGSIEAPTDSAPAPSAGPEAAKPLAAVTATLGGGRSVTVRGPGVDLDAMIAWLEELLVKARKARGRGVDLKGLLRLLREGARRAEA